MAVYRFLFAPVLLAVAVLAGSGERGAARPDAAMVVPEVRAASSATGPAVERASAAKPAARSVPRAERARVHPAP
jgi:hypothetical protein